MTIYFWSRNRRSLRSENESFGGMHSGGGGRRQSKPSLEH